MPDNIDTTKNNLPSLWIKYEKTKDINRLRQYAQWTLPHVCPPENTAGHELQGNVDSTGAQAVNHLANKLVLTLFRPGQPFFRLQVQSDDLEELKLAAERGDSDAAEVLSSLDQTLLTKEKQAMQSMDYNRFRTEAIMAAKGLIITGNALMYDPEDGKVQTYGIHDYCVKRDLSGAIIDILTRDMKDFDTFSKEVQDQLREDKTTDYTREENQNVTLYTRVKFGENKKYKLTQFADNVELDTSAEWAANDLPWTVLAWNLIRGEDYGRGLVEDYAGAFHALSTLTTAGVDIAALASDIKHLVRPGSVLDVNELNKALSGSYHIGDPEDVSTIQLDKLSDLQILELSITRLTQQISRAFLLNSSVQREAERVTAQEIRFMAQELELAHGGIYSRFAEEWQLHIARLHLKRVGLNVGTGQVIYPRIITGLDSLSRAGDMENLHMFLADLAALQNIPEEFRGAIDPLKFAAYAGARRGVEYEKFLKTADQIQQEQQQLQQQQQAQMQQQAQANVSEEAGKQAVQQET